MERIKYDMSLMKTMSLFETLTHTQLKDCFIDKNSMMLFVVDESQMSRAIGREGANVKRIEGLLNRKIKILGYTPDLIQFVRNVLYPLRVNGIMEQDGVVTIDGEDSRTKGLLIGKNSQNLKNNLSIIQRYFEAVKEIKVV
jgi:transcription termination/antitermination protein NusA